MLNEVSSLRIRDLEIFIEVARARSIREVARRLQTSSGQVSKIIQSIEKRLGIKLLKRSVSGVSLTSQGSDLLVITQELIANGEKIENLLVGRNKSKSSKVFAIASTSFLNTHFTAPIICSVEKDKEFTSFRFLDLAPDQLVPVGLRGGFDIAVHFGPIAWPTTWTTKSTGKSKWILCSRKDHPLAKRPTLKQILNFPFVVPTYWTNEGLVRGNDQFPMPHSKRKTGYETATADAAIPILRATDQIAFLPELLANPFIYSGQLRELKTTDVPLIERELFLSVKADIVPDLLFKELQKKMTEMLQC